MPIIAFPSRRLLPLAVSIFLTVAVSISGADLTAELRHAQSQSKSGVIRLDDRSVSRFITSADLPRPYTLFIFFDALQFYDNPDLRLRNLRSEFAILADSFITNHRNNGTDDDDNNNLFFCDIELRESQASFHLFGVNSLPHIRLVGPAVRSMQDERDEHMKQGDLTRMVQSMADFIESKTKFKIGPIKRPPFLSRWQLALILAGILALASFTVKKIVAGDSFLRDRQTWLAGAVFVYFFSVSGSMHTIIRSMPMFIVDSKNHGNVVFFYPDASVQLGAEGFAVGFLFTIVGLLLAFMNHFLVHVRSVKGKRIFMFVSLLVCFWAVKKVVLLDNWKTGYGIHAYWPSGW